MTPGRKPLNVLRDYSGKEIEQPDEDSSPSANPGDSVSPPEDLPEWLLDVEPVHPVDSLPGHTFSSGTDPSSMYLSSTPPSKPIQDSLLNQPAQPTAKARARLQFYGSSKRDRPGYVSPPRRGPTLAEQDTFRSLKRWHPSDDDLIIYGRKIAPESEHSEDDTEIASRGYPSSYMQQVSRERHQKSDRGQAMQGDANRDSRLGETFSSVQTSSNTGTASVATTCHSPRTNQELETLQIMSEINPQGYESLTRHLDRARGHSTQHRARSASPSDQLQDGYADDVWRPGANSDKEHDQEDDSSIRCLFPGVLKTYGALVGTPAPQARLKYAFSSLGARRMRRAASPAAPIFSPVTPPFTHGDNTLDRAEPSAHNSAKKNPGPLSNPKKRARKASNDEDSTPAQREFSVLRDEILDNPSKKRRVSSHLVRESVSEKYNANMGSARRRTDSSVSKSSNGTPQRRLSLRRVGSFANTKVGVLETPTQAAHQYAVNTSTLASTNHAGYVNTSEAQSSESMELLTTSDKSTIQNFMHSTYPDTSNKSQKSSQLLRRSTRLSALRQELHDLTPSKSTEEQHPEGANSTFVATSPEAVVDNSTGTSTHVPANKAQYTTANLGKDHSHTQTGRVSKSTATKTLKGLASSQLPQRRSDRIGRRRL